MTTTPTSKPRVRRQVNARRPVAQAAQDLLALPALLGSWYSTKRQLAVLEKSLKEGKSKIKSVVLANGIEDEKGSQYLELSEPVEGIASVKNQKAIRKGFSEDKAKEIFGKKGLLDTVTRTEIVFDPDAIELAFFSKKISQSELEAIFPTSVSFSLVLLDKDGKQIS